jgi:hypothetical protein
VNDHDISGALAPFRQVQASERLRVAVTRPAARPFQPSLVRRHPRVVAAAALVAVVAAAAGAAVTTSTDDPAPTGPRTEAAGGPVDIGEAQAVVFADGTTVSIGELSDVANHQRLQALFAEHGAELVIHERPVAPAADGRVLWIMADVLGDEAQSHIIPIDAGARVEVEVGRADPAADTEGLTLYEVFPDVEEAIDRDDPVATGQALERLGFRIRWSLIEAPGVDRDIDAPPDGTRVLSVLGPNGQWTDIDPSTDTLMVEVATPDVIDDLGH